MSKRLEGFAIPPNWDEVWICPDSCGHLQVTGYDEKGRKQYLYHPDWVAYRNASKYQKLLEFGEKLPLIRKRVQEDLQLKEWKKERVLALVVSVLDESFIRIGNKTYLESNNTYGLTTLRRKHLSVNEQDKAAILRYQAKSGKEREITIENETLVGLIKECSELPGYEIFRYKEDGKLQAVDSGDVNEYLQNIAGEDFSSKDFRTWGGTVVAVEEFPLAIKEVAENPKKSLLPTLVKRVAEKLGNTPAICREYYIHPAVLEAAEDGRLKKAIKEADQLEQQDDFDLRKCEKVALGLLKQYQKENRLEQVIIDKTTSG